jgi:excisionase family DNA binding protein
VVLVFRDGSEHRQAERRRAARVAITQTLAEDVSIKQASSRILQVICEGLEWDVGALWMVDKAANAIRCPDIRHRPSARVREFVARTRAASFTSGASLPGRVWGSRQPLWIPDVVNDPRFMRADAAAADGLHGAFACPVALTDEVLTLEEAAALLKLPADTVRSRAEEGDLPGRRFGNEWRFAVEAVRVFFASPGGVVVLFLHSLVIYAVVVTVSWGWERILRRQAEVQVGLLAPHNRHPAPVQGQGRALLARRWRQPEHWQLRDRHG